MSIPNSTIWINHHSYNQLPSVEDSRASIDESSQIAITNTLATVAFTNLLGKIGTTLTHRHWFINENESIVGSIEDKKLLSTPKRRKDTVCPTTWIVAGKDLLATEGIDNPSKEVIEIAKRVQENASKVLSGLPLDSNGKFSTLSIAIDPREYFHTDKKCFLEKNKGGTSILEPVEDKELESLKEQIVITYISMDSPQIEKILDPNGSIRPRQQYCLSGCSRDPGDGYHERYHVCTR